MDLKGPELVPLSASLLLAQAFGGGRTCYLGACSRRGTSPFLQPGGRTIDCQAHGRLCAIVFLIFLVCPVALRGQVSLHAGAQGTTEGFVVLDWSVSAPFDPDERLVLEQSSSPNFNSATAHALGSGRIAGQVTVTGLPDGVYYFRAGSPVAWSDPVAVEIRHHPLNQAFFFFFTGLVLFLLLVGFLVHGSRAAHSHAMRSGGQQ